jgi:acetyl-CoA C-acetyltransferase
MKEVVIVSGARTAIGKMGGSLLPFSLRKLAALVIKEAMNRAPLVEPEMIEDVFLGCTNNFTEDMNVGRLAALEAGLPITCPGLTIARACPSSMEALVQAARKIMCDEADVCIAGGVEILSNAPFHLKTGRWGNKLGHQKLIDSLWDGLYAGGDEVMGLTAERMAEKWGISRLEQDEVALRSHNNAERANKDGRFKDEIVPVTVKTRKKEFVFEQDEHFRPGLTMEQLSELPPAFKKDGTVTAGNSSGLNDAAAAVILMSMDKARELGITPLCKYVCNAVAGVDPALMGIGPVPATEMALKRARMEISDVDLVEINEAFAAQYIACERDLKLNRDIVNVNGSGIGLGHPVGATGVRMIVTLIHELIKRDKSVGLASLCGGGGLGLTTIFERI